MYVCLLTYDYLYVSAVHYCFLRKGKLWPEISVCDAVIGNARYTSLLCMHALAQWLKFAQNVDTFSSVPAVFFHL